MEFSVAEGEDPAIARQEPVAAAAASRGDCDDGFAQVPLGSVAVEDGCAVSYNGAAAVCGPVAGPVIDRSYADDARSRRLR